MPKELRLAAPVLTVAEGLLEATTVLLATGLPDSEPVPGALGALGALGTEEGAATKVVVCMVVGSVEDEEDEDEDDDDDDEEEEVLLLVVSTAAGTVVVGMVDVVIGLLRVVSVVTTVAEVAGDGAVSLA